MPNRTLTLTIIVWVLLTSSLKVLVKKSFDRNIVLKI